MRNSIKIIIHLASLVILVLFSNDIFAQPYVVDKMVGTVGRNSILYSDVEDQYLQMKAQKITPLPSKCEIFEEMLSQKLLINQARIDSIEVTPAEIEMELDRRLRYFIEQIGSEEKLVKYFGKPIVEIKMDMEESIKNQVLVQRMTDEITKSMSVTPSDVKGFYKKLPQDSIPYIEAKAKVAQIVLYPKSDKEEIYQTRERLLDFRERILKGEKFSTLAALYSQGPSSSKGGDIGWSLKAELDPAYAKAAFSLKEGQVSKIVESEFGYHIIQLIERTEQKVHTRHILLKPEIPLEEKEKTKKALDSIVKLIRTDTLTFSQAALKFSEDETTKFNDGLKINFNTGNTEFELDEFPSSEYYIIRDLEVGEISEPFETEDDKGKTVYKVLQLKEKTKPHVANLEQDFELLKNMTIENKKSEIIDDWLMEKIKTSYIKINPPYNDCKFDLKWLK